MSDTRSFAALRQPGFRGYFLGVASVMMADAIEHVISYWVIFQKFQSPTLGGFAIVSHWLPFLLLSVYSGALADRYDPRRIIQVGVALFALVSAAWGLLFLTDSLEMWHAAVLLVLHGCAGVIWGPSVQVLIHHMVTPSGIASAVRLSATARWLGLMLGPAVGAPLLLLLGPVYGIFANALLYVPFFLWVRTVPFTRHARAAPLRGFADVVAAVRVVREHRVLLAMTLLAGSASFLVGNAYHAQMPEFARDLGHTDADFTYSMLFAADALGALVAGIVLESRGLLAPRARTAFVLALLWCLAIGGFALATWYPLALALLFAAGFLELAFFAMAQTLLQLNAPAEMRGRVIGVFIMSALGMRAFSGVTIGLGGALIGIHASLALSAAVLLVTLLGLGRLLAAGAR